MAMDISTLPFDDDQFADWTRMQAELRQQELVQHMEQGIDLKARERELEIANNFENTGYAMPDESFSNADDDDDNWFLRRSNDVQTGFNMLFNKLGQAVMGDTEGGEVPSFEDYRAKGGLLLEEEWNDFSDSTKKQLFERKATGEQISGVTGTPGISHALGVFSTLERAGSTAVSQVADLRGRLFGPETTNDFMRDLAPFFSTDGWSDAWKESEERTLGNALVDTMLSPKVARSTLDKWRRTNSAYQMGSIGAEVLGTWYLDGGALALRGAANTGRMLRKEMPLEQGFFGQPSRMYSAVREAQQGREVISVRSAPAKKYATWRAESLLAGQRGVEEFARSHDFATFANLPMFSKRSSDGLAGAKALHIAANSDNPDLLKYTWGALNGDARAIAEIERMKLSPSEALLEFGGDARVLAEAYDATKRRIPLLEAEIEDLNKIEPNSPFHRWEIHADQRVKQEQVTRAKEALAAYGDDYLDWLSLMGTKELDPSHPTLSMYRAPKAAPKGWNDVGAEPVLDGTQRRFFMKHQFGIPHQVVKLPKAAILKKTGTVAIHDMDNGLRGVNRYFDQLEQILDYTNPEARARYIDEWTKAPTNYDRYKVLHQMEEENLIDALSLRLNISPELARTIFHKVDAERTASINGVMSGKGQVYSSAPTLAERLQDDASNVRLLTEADDEGMVTFELMDHGRLTTITTHESELVPRVAPVDPTQTPNYYRPADIRALYHEMKRHEDFLHAVDAGPVKWTKAEVARVNDLIGTKFYSLWKPAQLWRLGWPQRVLMDEGLRAAAIFGPMYWLTGPGAEAVGTIATNTLARDLETLSSVITGRWRPGRLDIGDGPLKAATKHAENSFAYDNQIADAVKLPASRFPKINVSRNQRLRKRVAAEAQHLRSRQAFAAWDRAYTDISTRVADARREMDDAFSEALETGNEGRFLRAQEEVLAWDLDRPARLNQIYEKMDAARIRMQDSGLRLQEEFGTEGTLYDILNQRLMDADWRLRTNQPAAVQRKGVPLAFDPVDASELSDGFVVPIPNVPTVKVPKGSSLQPVDTAIDARNVHYFFEQNAELLTRNNIRLVMDEDGVLTPAFYFKGKGARGRAEQALRDVSDSLDIDAQPKMFDIGKGELYYVQSKSDLSPMQEELFRYLRDVDEEIVTPGQTPARLPSGEQETRRVFHGTDRELDSDIETGEVLMHPREDVSAYNGQMVGPGFYTTVDQSVAEDYGFGLDARLYTVRNSRTGELFETFDLDKPMTRQDFAELVEWVKGQGRARPHDGLLEMDGGFLVDDMVYALEDVNKAARRSSHGDYGWFMTKKLKRKGQISWANFFESFPEGPRKKFISRFLEERRHAGVLTHRGGTTRGSGDGHQVYVWLRPEELEVLPAYSKSGKWEHVIEWWGNPSSREVPMAVNPVPENRIVRIGDRNPMIRDLHTTHAKLEARKEGLTGKKRLTDPEVVELTRRQHELMEALGLEYKGRASGGDPDLEAGMTPNAWGQDWYEIKDPDRFNRTLAEAHAFDEEVDFARAANGDLRAQEQLESAFSREFDMEDFDNLLDDPLRQIAAKLRRKHGSGSTTIAHPDGSTVSYPNVFEGHAGEVRRGLVSSAKAVDDLTANHGGGLDLLRRQAAGHRVYSPPSFSGDALKRGTAANRKAVQYFHMWADMVNDQIGNSPIWDKMLRGWDDQRVANWLRDTPEGYRIRNEIMDPSQSIELFVNEHRARLDYYLPSKKLQRLLAKRRLTPSELRKAVHNDNLPDVFGPDLEMLRTGWAKKTADAIWKSLGTIPIDALSRQPFAKASYNMHMQALIRQTEKEFLDGDTIARLQQVAHRRTLNDVRTTLFDLTDATNMTDALRFIAPFWNAQQEAIVKWLHIIMERPETIARFFNGQEAVYRNFVVVDEDGNEVDSPFGEREGGTQKRGMFGLGIYHPTDKVLLNVPGWARKSALGKALQAIGRVGIPLGSANTVLQGEMPLLPGPGPYLTVPVDKFLRAVSDTHGVELQETIYGDAYRWLFPIGRPSGGFQGVMEQISPGSVRRMLSASSPEDDVAKANLQWMVGRELHYDAERNGTKPPSESDIAKATNFLWGLRTFTSFVAPVQMEYRPKHQMWIDEAHRMREEFGVEWFDEFIKRRGKAAALYAISSSNSLPGVPPTLQGMEEWEDNKKLIAKYPEWGEAIISPDAYSDDYNQDAYRAQFEINLGPLDSRSLRDVRDASSRFAEAERRIGWLEFRDFMNALNAELYARGLTSLQQADAAPLAQLKAAFLAEQSDKYPDWAKDYATTTRDINIRIDELRSFAFNKTFDQRPDMQGVRQYLMIREMATEQLDQRYAQGGSRSLQTDENADVRGWFYDQVGQLVLSNPSFGDFYTRFLDGDTLTQGGD